jgi:hypothetical protein
VLKEERRFFGKKEGRVRNDDRRQNHKDKEREEKEADEFRVQGGADRVLLDETETDVRYPESKNDHVSQAEDNDETFGHGVPLDAMHGITKGGETHP